MPVKTTIAIVVQMPVLLASCISNINSTSGITMNAASNRNNIFLSNCLGYLQCIESESIGAAITRFLFYSFRQRLAWCVCRAFYVSACVNYSFSGFVTLWLFVTVRLTPLR